MEQQIHLQVSLNTTYDKLQVHDQVSDYCTDENVNLFQLCGAMCLKTLTF
jgi:hypothetical protein